MPEQSLLIQNSASLTLGCSSWTYVTSPLVDFGMVEKSALFVL